MFESRLLSAMEQLDPSLPTLVEAEGSKIGERMVPPALWRLMIKAPRISLHVPSEARARYLAGVYAGTVSDIDRLESLLARLPGRHGRKAVAAWRAMAEAGDLESLAGALIEAHYDPAYDRVAALDPRPRLGVVELADLLEPDLETAADRVAALAAER